MELLYVLLGGVLTVAGGWFESRFRVSEKKGSEEREQVRRIRQAVFTLLGIRDQVVALRSGLEIIPILSEGSDTGKEEELRLELMQSNRESAAQLITEMGPALVAVSGVNPFLANLLQAVTNSLEQTIRSDYRAALGNKRAYEGFRRIELARVVKTVATVDRALIALGREAFLGKRAIEDVIEEKNRGVERLMEAGRLGTPSALAQVLEGIEPSDIVP